MPTTNIIGYLWSQRQDLNIDGVPDLFELIHDLTAHGVDVVTVEDITILGSPVGTSVQLAMREPEEWAELVENAILEASVDRTIAMLHFRERDPE